MEYPEQIQQQIIGGLKREAAKQRLQRELGQCDRRRAELIEALEILERNPDIERLLELM